MEHSNKRNYSVKIIDNWDTELDSVYCENLSLEEAKEICDSLGRNESQLVVVFNGDGNEVYRKGTTLR